ncbi:MAG: site-2 protease family protein [Actinobacteria bacterium]|nr:site-2 protease family protein [Actinomycetota bacterium]
MGRDIPLGRIAGIRVGMSWSVPLIALAYAAVLAGNRLPAEAPGQARSAYWIAGLIGAALFFLSLLAHEIGHALVARREGIGVLGISLWLLGGVTRMDHEAGSAGAELRIAGVGPLTSAACGVVFLALNRTLVDQLGTAELYGALFGWLGGLNLLLAAFNLLPGSPLDGGRVLSAALWRIAGDQTQGQQIAATVGQVLGAGLLLVGGILTFGDTNTNGFWMLIAGAFIFSAATAERRSAPGLAVLRRVRLGQVMRPDPPVLPEWMSVQDLVARTPGLAPHEAVVTQAMDGRITGLVTAALVRATDPATWTRLTLRDVAFPIGRLVTARVDAPVAAAVQRASHAPCDRILVLDDSGRVVGITGPEAADQAERLAAPAPPMPPGPYPPGPYPPGSSPPVGAPPLPR